MQGGATTRRLATAGLVAVALLLLAGCSRRDDQVEQQLKQLQERVDQLENENRQLRGRVATPPELAAHFADDPTNGTLAGLVPGDTLEHARELYGAEARTRAWKSEGDTITEHEWDWPAGVHLRADEVGGRLVKVAVALSNPQSVNIPTLGGVTIGGDTFASVKARFAATLTTDLRIWGAQGIYTVAQFTPYPPDAPDTRWRLEFDYEMPPGLSKGVLSHLEEQVHELHHADVLDSYLEKKSFFLLALEEVR